MAESVMTTSSSSFSKRQIGKFGSNSAEHELREEQLPASKVVKAFT